MLLPNYQTSTPAQQAFALDENALNDKVILISGATGGLGTTLSLTCAQAGATVVLASRSQKKLEKLYDVIVDSGAPDPAIIPLQQDKAGPSEYHQLSEYLQSEFGKLDALVHCSAELGTPTPQISIDNNEWVKVMNVNLNAARLLSLHSMPLLMQSDLGSLTFLLDHKATAYWGGYGVSKQALQSLMHMLADETDNRLGEDGYPLLAVNGYDPGPMRTPLRRRAFPGELVNETELPHTRLGPLLSLIARIDRKVTGAAVSY